MYIDKLEVIVNKCSNAYHSTIKIKPVDVKSNIYINSSKEINDKDPKFKIGDIIRISNMFQIGLKKFWWLKKLKTLCHGHILIVILTAKKLLKCFTKMYCKKEIKKSLDLKK